MARPASPAVSPFGARLQQWRRRRGISQLRLAAEIGSTPRHLSFPETGRSQPSREMVGRLAAALGVSLREQNELLHAAGLPAAYPQAHLGDPDLAPFRAAIDRLLEAHLPYPAMVVDGRWNVVSANQACATLFGGDLVGGNMIRRYFGDRHAAEWMVNWTEVAWAGLGRLHQQLNETPFDEELRALVALAETAIAGLPRPAAPGSELVVCPWFRVGDSVIRTIGMVARFDSAADVTLDELRIKLTYPQDAAAERFFREQNTAHQ